LKRTYYVARHGQTIWNAEMRIQGQEDIPLTRDGYRNRRGLFFLLKDQPIEVIYTSALQRSIMTAQSLAKHHHLPLHSTSNLNEISFGILEGEVLSDFDAWAVQTWNWWLEKPLERRVPAGGENYQDLLERVDAFLSSIAGKPEGVVLVVAHFRINQCLVGRLADKLPQELLNIQQANNQVYRIDHEEGGRISVAHTFTSSDPQAEVTWQPGLLTSPTALDPRQRKSVMAG